MFSNKNQFYSSRISTLLLCQCMHPCFSIQTNILSNNLMNFLLDVRGRYFLDVKSEFSINNSNNVSNIGAIQNADASNIHNTHFLDMKCHSEKLSNFFRPWTFFVKLKQLLWCQFIENFINYVHEICILCVFPKTWHSFPAERTYLGIL